MILFRVFACFGRALSFCAPLISGGRIDPMTEAEGL